MCVHIRLIEIILKQLKANFMLLIFMLNRDLPKIKFVEEGF